MGILCGDWNDPVNGTIDQLVRAGTRVRTRPVLRSAYEPPFPSPAFTAQDLSATWCKEEIPGLAAGSYMASLDAMYFSPAVLVTQAVFAGLEFEDTVKDGLRTGIPNARYPSDHVALAAT